MINFLKKKFYTNKEPPEKNPSGIQYILKI